ncbi:MAG: crossover junction endodeoxyribonuclease RuvC [Chitinophagaceae bacterium]
MHTPDKIILGIDPGTVIMGYSIIVVRNNIITVKEINVLKLPAKKNNYERLQLIYERVTGLVNLYSPGELAIEAPFFGKNVQSMLKLGRAQGVAIAAAMNFGIPVTEYSPKKVKQSITGNGNANKEQIWKMLLNLIKLENKPNYFDATDALAVAICHHFSCRSPLKKIATKKKSAITWEKFAVENPGRVL